MLEIVPNFVGSSQVEKEGEWIDVTCSGNYHSQLWSHVKDLQLYLI